MGGACTTATSHDPTPSASDKSPAIFSGRASVHQGSGLKTIRAMRTTTDREETKENESKLAKNEVDFLSPTRPPQQAEKDNENDDGLATEIAGGTSNTCRNRSATSACFGQSSISHDAMNTKYNSDNNNNTTTAVNNTSNVGSPYTEGSYKPLVAFGTDIPDSSTGRGSGVPAGSNDTENDADRDDHGDRARFVVAGGTEVQPLPEEESGKKRRGMTSYYEETYRPSRNASNASSTPTKNSEIKTKGGAALNDRYPHKSQHPNTVQQSTEDEDEEDEESSSSAHDGIEGKNKINQSDRGRHLSIASDDGTRHTVDGQRGAGKHPIPHTASDGDAKDDAAIFSKVADSRAVSRGAENENSESSQRPSEVLKMSVLSGGPPRAASTTNTVVMTATTCSSEAGGVKTVTAHGSTSTTAPSPHTVSHADDHAISPAVVANDNEHEEVKKTLPGEEARVIRDSKSDHQLPPHILLKKNTAATITLRSALAGHLVHVGDGHTKDEASTDRHILSDERALHSMQQQQQPASAVGSLPPFAPATASSSAVQCLRISGGTLDRGSITSTATSTAPPYVSEGAAPLGPPLAPSPSTTTTSSSGVLQHQIPMPQFRTNSQSQREAYDPISIASVGEGVYAGGGDGTHLGAATLSSSANISAIHPLKSAMAPRASALADLMTPVTIVGPAFVDISSSGVDGTSPNPLSDPAHAHVDSNNKMSTAGNNSDAPRHQVASSSPSFHQRPPRDSNFSLPQPQPQLSPQQQQQHQQHPSSPDAPAPPPPPPLLTEAEKVFLKTVKHHREQVMASREFTKQTEHYKLFLAQVRREKRAAFEGYFNKSMVRLKEVLANPATTFFCGPLNRPLLPSENIPTPFEDPSVYLLVPPQDAVSRRMENRLEALLHSWVRGLPSEETGLKGQRLTHPALPEEFTSSFYYDRAMVGKIGEAVMTAAMAERERERERREANAEANAKRSRTSVSSLLGASDAQSPALNVAILEGGAGGITRSSSSPLTNHNNSNNSLSVVSNLGVGGINSANTATIHKDNPLLSAKAVLVPRPKPEPGVDVDLPSSDKRNRMRQNKENDEEHDTNTNNNNADDSNSPFINIPPFDITSDLTSYAITMPLCDKSAYPAVKEWTMESAAIASGLLLQPNSAASNTSAPAVTGGGSAKATSASTNANANNLTAAAASAATGEESYAKRLLTAIILKSNSSGSARGVGGQPAPSSTTGTTGATGGGSTTSTTAQQQRDGPSSSTAVEKLHTIANTVITQHTAHLYFDGKRNTNSSPWSLADAEKEDIREWESAVMKSDHEYYSSSQMVNSPQYWQQQVLAMRSGQSREFGECDGLAPPPHPSPQALNHNGEARRGEDFLRSLIAKGDDSTTPTASSGTSNNNNTNLPVTAATPLHQQQHQQRPRFSLSNSGGTMVSSGGPLLSDIVGGSSTSGGTLTSTSVVQQDPHPPIVASRPLSPSNKRPAPFVGGNSNTNSSGSGGNQYVASSSVYLQGGEGEDSAAFAADPFSFFYPERVEEDGLVRSPPHTTNTGAPFILDPSRTHYHCAIDVNIGSVVTHFGLGGNDGENESLSFGNLVAAVAAGNQHNANQQQHASPRARDRTGTMHYLGATSMLPSISTNIVGGVGGLLGGHATSISLAAGGGNLFGSAFSIQTLNNLASSLAGGGVIVGRGSVATSGGIGSFVNFNMMPRMSIGVNAPLEISLNLASPQEFLNGYQNGFGESQPVRTVQSIVVNQNDYDDHEDEENEEEEEEMGKKGCGEDDVKEDDDLGEASGRSFDPPSRRETLRGGVVTSAMGSVVSPENIKKNTALKKDNEAGDASTSTASKKVRKARFAMSDFPEPQRDTTRTGGGPQAFTSIPASAFSLFNFNYKQQSTNGNSAFDGVYPSRTYSIAANALQSQANTHSDASSKPTAAASVALTAALKKQILRETLNSITNPFVSLKPIIASQATDHVFCTAMETANTLLLSSPLLSFSSPPTATSGGSAVCGVVADDETSMAAANSNGRKNASTSASTTPPNVISNDHRSLTPCGGDSSTQSAQSQQQQSHHPSGLPTSPSRLQNLISNYANTPTIVASSSNTNGGGGGSANTGGEPNIFYPTGLGSPRSREHRQAQQHKIALGYQKDGDEMSGLGNAGVAAATNAVIRKNPLISSAISRTFEYPHPCAAARYTVAALMLYNSYYTTPEALRSWLTKSANQLPAVVKPEPKPHPHGMMAHHGNPNRSPLTPQRGLGAINPRSPTLNPSPSASSSRGAAAGFPAVGRWGVGAGGMPAEEPQSSTLTAGGGDTGELTGSAFVPVGAPRAPTPQQLPPQQGMGWSSFTGGESSSNPPLVGPPPTSTTKSSRRAGTRVPAVTMLDEGLVNNGVGAHGGGGEHQSHASQSLTVSNSVGGSVSRSTHGNGAFTGAEGSMSSVVSGFEGGTGSRPGSRQQRTRQEGGDKEGKDDDGSRAQSASPVALRPLASFHQYNPQQYHHTNHTDSALTSQSDLDTANIPYTYSAAPGLLSSLATGAGVAANVSASGEFESSSSNTQHQRSSFHHYQGYGVGISGAVPQGLTRSVASSSSQFGYSMMVMPTAAGGAAGAQQYHFNRGGALPSVRAAAVPLPSGFVGGGGGGGSSISVASTALEMSFGGGSEFGGGGSLASSPYHRGSRRRVGGGGGGAAGSSFSSLAALQGQVYGSSSPMGSGIGLSRGGFLNQNPHSSLSNMHTGRPNLLAGGNEHSLVGGGLDGGVANSSSSVNYNSNFFHAGHNSFLANTNFNYTNNNNTTGSSSLSRANTSSMTSYARGGRGGGNGGAGLLFGSTAKIIVLDSDAPSAESAGYRGESRHQKAYAPSSSSSASASSSNAPSPTLAAVAGGSIHAYSGGRSRKHGKKRRSSSIAVSLAGTFYTFSFYNEQKPTPQLLPSASRPQPSQLLSVNNPSHKNRLPSLATEITSKQQQSNPNQPTGSPGLDLEDPSIPDAPHPKGIPYVSQSKTTSRVASRMRRTVAEAAAISLQQQQNTNGSVRGTHQVQAGGSRGTAHNATRRSKTAGQHKKAKGVKKSFFHTSRRPAPTPVDVMQKFLGNHTTIGRPSFNPMADLTVPPPDVNKTIERLAAAAGVSGPTGVSKSKTAPTISGGASGSAISANTPSATPFSPSASAAARGYSRHSPSAITKSPIGPFTHQHFVVSPSHHQATALSNAGGSLLSILEASSVPPPPPPPVQPPTSHAVLPMLLPWRHLPYPAPSTLTLLLMSAGLIAERAKLIRDTRRALLKSLPLIRHLAGEKERAVVEAITCGGEYVDVDVYSTEELETAKASVGSAKYGGQTKPSTVSTDPAAGVFGVDGLAGPVVPPPSLGRNGSLTLANAENEGVVQSGDATIAAAPALNTFLIAASSRSPSLSAMSANPTPSAIELSTTTTKANKLRSANSPSASTTADRGVNAMPLLSNPLFDQPPLMCASTSVDYGAGQSLVGGASSTGVQYSLPKQGQDRGSLQLFIPPAPPHFSSMVSNPALINPTRQEDIHPPPTPPPQLLAPDVILLPEPVPAFVMGRLLPALNDKVHAMVRRRARRAKQGVKKAQISSTPSGAAIGSHQDRVTANGGVPNPTGLLAPAPAAPPSTLLLPPPASVTTTNTTDSSGTTERLFGRAITSLSANSTSANTTTTTTGAVAGNVGVTHKHTNESSSDLATTTAKGNKQQHENRVPIDTPHLRVENTESEKRADSSLWAKVERRVFLNDPFGIVMVNARIHGKKKVKRAKLRKSTSSNNNTTNNNNNVLNRGDNDQNDPLANKKMGRRKNAESKKQKASRLDSPTLTDSSLHNPVNARRDTTENAAATEERATEGDDESFSSSSSLSRSPATASASFAPSVYSSDEDSSSSSVPSSTSSLLCTLTTSSSSSSIWTDGGDSEKTADTSLTDPPPVGEETKKVNSKPDGTEAISPPLMGRAPLAEVNPSIAYATTESLDAVRLPAALLGPLLLDLATGKYVPEREALRIICRWAREAASSFSNHDDASPSQESAIRVTDTKGNLGLGRQPQAAAAATSTPPLLPPAFALSSPAGQEAELFTSPKLPLTNSTHAPAVAEKHFAEYQQAMHRYMHNCAYEQQQMQLQHSHMYMPQPPPVSAATYRLGRGSVTISLMGQQQQHGAQSSTSFSLAPHFVASNNSSQLNLHPHPLTGGWEGTGVNGGGGVRVTSAAVGGSQQPIGPSNNRQFSVTGGLAVAGQHHPSSLLAPNPFTYISGANARAPMGSGGHVK